MSVVAERLGRDPVRLWAVSVLGLVAALIGGSLLFPRTVYDRFVWQYFWGPVQADAHTATCAVRAGGKTTYRYAAEACRTAAGTVAYPGYTLVSEVGYVVVLLLALTGLVFLLRHLDLGTERRFFYALVPFMFFGGALRVVEDVTDDPSAGVDLLAYPLNTLVISPVIYFTVFGVTLASLLVAVELVRRGVVDDYHRPLAGFGTLASLLTVGFLLVLAVIPGNAVTFHAQVLLVILVGTTVATWATWRLIETSRPHINAGTEEIGLVVLWAHAVDGVANVVGLDWMTALGAGPNLVPKHPVNRAIVEFTGSTLPGSVLAVTGDAWPFLVVKLAAATFVLWIFEPEMFDESPRYSMLLLVAVVAVGLGPGTRDMLRATFGV